MTNNPYKNTEAFSIFLKELDLLSSEITKILKFNDIEFSNYIECNSQQTIFHRIKGVAGMFGYDSLGLLAAKLEGFCKDGSFYSIASSERNKLYISMLSNINSILVANNEKVQIYEE
jgi:hypothetical protein